MMKKPGKEKTAGRKLGISLAAGVIIILFFSTVLFALLYNNIKKDSFILQNMQSYLLEGSSDTLKVSDLLYQYNGTDFALSGGKLTHLGEAKTVKGYDYKVILTDMSGKSEPITLYAGSLVNNISELPAQIDMGSISGAAEAIDYANLADKYKIKVVFNLTTAAGVENDEVFLKITELNSDFFKK